MVDPRGPVTLEVGTVVVLPQGSQWDVINDPSPNHRYEALVLQFGEGAIREFNEHHVSEQPFRYIEDYSRFTIDSEFEESLRRAAETLESPSSSRQLKYHRIKELLLLLAERGCLLKPRDDRPWPDQLRIVIRQRPHADWSVARLAQTFHVSESTLRRRLSVFGVTASDLVREVRLEVALLLLQSTHLPVGEVSHRCGFDSHSRFSAIFRARYGFAPSYLRTESSKPVRVLEQILE